MERHPEQDRIISSLADTGILPALSWAHYASVLSTLSTYEEDAGHDATFLGTLRHNQLCDRIDRVGSTGKYIVSDDETLTSDVDVARMSLSSEELASFTPLESGILVRQDYRQSPAWVYGNYRIFLQSVKYGKMERIPWHTISKTKLEIAERPFTSTVNVFAQQGDLFPQYGHPETITEDEYINLVLAHSLDIVTGQQDLVLGRPRATKENEPHWHWYERFTIDPLDPIPGSKDTKKSNPLIDPTEDAPVQLRKSSERKHINHNGQQDHFGA